MKLFFNSVLFVIGTFSLTVIGSETAKPNCTLDATTKFHSELTNSTSKKHRDDILNKASLFLETCHTNMLFNPASTKLQVEGFYNFINDVLNAQLETKKTHDCIKLGDAATEPWDSPYKTLKDLPVYTTIQNTITACKAKREKEIAKNFSAEKCPLFGSSHKYSSAIAVPQQWHLIKETSCLYLYGGKNRDKPEEEGIHLRENYPHLILLTTNGEDVYEKYIDFNQGDLATKEICLSGRIENIDFLSTSGDAKNPLIRIHSYAEHCLRDNASFAIDSVYKIDRQKGLLPVNELLIRLHP